MKTRTWFLLAAGLVAIVLGMTGLALSAGDRAAAQVLPASVNRDCAPWDGAAFTIAVPLESGSEIMVSIWQAPEIKRPVRFVFPDETGRSGSATYLARGGAASNLKGTVLLWRVDKGAPVEGEFDLLTEQGQRLKGRFRAEWGDLVTFCG